MVTIIKPVKFDGLMVIRSRKKDISGLQKKFKGFAERNKLTIDVERKGKLSKVV